MDHGAGYVHNAPTLTMSTSIVLVDAHVHVHAGASVEALLQAAAANFAGVAESLGRTQWQGVLLLAEMTGVDWFDQASNARAPLVSGSWTITAVPTEGISVLASGPQGQLLIVAGRQLATREGLEVLMLGTREIVPDGMDLDATLSAARRSDAIVVMPWAAGKWLGQRGKAVAGIFADRTRQPLFAGDNGGRPAFWPEPDVFGLAEGQGRPVLPGSDPLPLPGEERRAGSRGCWFPGSLPLDAPATALRNRLLAAVPAEVQSFGQPEGPLRFFSNQLALRVAKRRRDEQPSPDMSLQSGARLTTNSENPDVVTSSADYARRFSGRAGAYLLQVQTRSVLDAISGLTPGTALDVGGGHGQLVDPLTTAGWRVTVHGTDAACGRNLRELHGKHDCDFVQGDLFSLPFADRSVDLVIAVRLLSHVEDWPRLVGEMCRVARHAVVLDYPCKSGLNALTPMLFGLKKSLEGNTRTYRSFARQELSAQFERHNFHFGREIRQFFMPMVVHRVAQAAAPLRGAENVFRLVGLTGLAGSPAIIRMDRDE